MENEDDKGRQKKHGAAKAKANRHSRIEPRTSAERWGSSDEGSWSSGTLIESGTLQLGICTLPDSDDGTTIDFEGDAFRFRSLTAFGGGFSVDSTLYLEEETEIEGEICMPPKAEGSVPTE
jgi:hypothetical protein